jgi:hypothetical protein
VKGKQTDAATKTDINQDDTEQSLKEKESQSHTNTSKKAKLEESNRRGRKIQLFVRL